MRERWCPAAGASRLRNLLPTSPAVLSTWGALHLFDAIAQRTHAPQPVGDRLLARAAKLRGLADDHDRTRITLETTT
ncbi:hypothetical protein ACIBF7_43085 [Nonomuraea sp. NPDC050478]|uniref:hypothetical protein n=1 Tax=Nonomuraea sp. NPDC050478 TaxID=3364365 RepID=UPI0037BD4BC1